MPALVLAVIATGLTWVLWPRLVIGLFSLITWSIDKMPKAKRPARPSPPRPRQPEPKRSPDDEWLWNECESVKTTVRSKSAGRPEPWVGAMLRDCDRIALGKQSKADAERELAAIRQQNDGGPKPHHYAQMR